jgi:hypothetical protein
VSRENNALSEPPKLSLVPDTPEIDETMLHNFERLVLDQKAETDALAENRRLRNMLDELHHRTMNSLYLQFFGWILSGIVSGLIVSFIQRFWK